MRAVMVAVFAPERRGGTNEIAVSDTVGVRSPTLWTVGDLTVLEEG